MRNLVIFTCLAVLTGCASTYPVQRIGDEKYQVSATASPARGGQAGAQSMAVEAANQKCESLGKHIEVVDTQTHWTFPAAGSAIVTFNCK